MVGRAERGETGCTFALFNVPAFLSDNTPQSPGIENTPYAGVLEIVKGRQHRVSQLHGLEMEKLLDGQAKNVELRSSRCVRRRQLIGSGFNKGALRGAADKRAYPPALCERHNRVVPGFIYLLLGVYHIGIEALHEVCKTWHICELVLSCGNPSIEYISMVPLHDICINTGVCLVDINN